MPITDVLRLFFLALHANGVRVMKVGDLVFVYGSLVRGGRSDLSKHHTLQFIDDDAINGSLADFGFLQERRPILLLPTDPLYEQDWAPWLPYVIGDVFRIRHASVIPLLDAFARSPDKTNRVLVKTRHGRKAYVYSHIIGGLNA